MKNHNSLLTILTSFWNLATTVPFMRHLPKTHQVSQKRKMTMMHSLSDPDNFNLFWTLRLPVYRSWRIRCWCLENKRQKLQTGQFSTSFKDYTASKLLPFTNKIFHICVWYLFLDTKGSPWYPNLKRLRLNGKETILHFYSTLSMNKVSTISQLKRRNKQKKDV